MSINSKKNVPQCYYITNNLYRNHIKILNIPNAQWLTISTLLVAIITASYHRKHRINTIFNTDKVLIHR